MLPTFALVLAGLFLVASLVFLAYRAANKRAAPAISVPPSPPSPLERAVLTLGTQFNGVQLDSAFEGISWDAALAELAQKQLDVIRTGETLEFQLSVEGRCFNVQMTKEPDGLPGVIFRVEDVLPWMGELHKDLRQLGLHDDTPLSRLVFLERLEIVGEPMPRNALAEPRKVPDDIVWLSNLKALELSHRNIAKLPKEIGRLSKLHELKLGGNGLRELPDGVCDLTELRILNLGANRLLRLPTKLGQLRQLEVLDLSDNELGGLPWTIVEIKSLRRLHLQGNPGMVLSKRQETWVHMLMARGCEVVVDDEIRVVPESLY